MLPLYYNLDSQSPDSVRKLTQDSRAVQTSNSVFYEYDNA